MTNKLKSKIVLGFILGAMFVTAMGIALVAKANPLKMPATSRSATATTTVTYMTTGRATTTNQYDAYQQSATVPSAYALDKATLFIFMSGSSTASTLRTYIEYSQDGTDWYQDGGTLAEAYATTTKLYDISQVQGYTLNFASTTAGWASPKALSATTTRAITVKTPTRFVRAVFVVPVGSDPLAVWSEWVPIRQDR